MYAPRSAPYLSCRTFNRPAVVLLVMATLLLPVSLHAQAQTSDLSFLTTAAERTNFEETTRYDEVMAFLDVAVAQHPDLHLTTFGYSLEGRPLPLVIFGKLASLDPDAIRQSDRLRIFIQGNIHAGEVCGKEALLMMIRSIAKGAHEAWADSAIIMMAPIYNADGNERVNLFNRPRQNGPMAGMGQRPNAQGLDLNRDHMKMKSPEARSLIRLMNEYDPHVLVDLHTTNGTRHGYHITYSPPLNPNTDTAIDGLLRNELLPAVQAGLKARSGWDSYYYGNLPFRRGEAGWYTFDHRPRFNNNYIGLRNRVAILSEAYAYATFQERVLASLYFTEAIVEESIHRRGAIESAIAEAEQRTAPGLEQGLRFEPFRNQDQVDILMGTVETKTNPYSGAPFFERLDSTYVQTMPEYGAFAATEQSTIPGAYVVDAATAGMVSGMLSAHGIRFDVLEADMEMAVHAFRVDSTMQAERPFQQINEQTLWGRWEAETRTFGAGSLRVPMDQQLARLAFYLLEPRSDDGLTNWAFFADGLEAGTRYPVYREEP